MSRETAPGYSDLYERALREAANAHLTHKRKGSETPYITHLVHVAMILLHYGFPPEVVAAGLLHDAVEDVGYSLDQVEAHCGRRVKEIVAALSEHKQDERGRRRPWAERKQEALEHLRQDSLDVVAVKAADTVHNVRVTCQDARREGARAWQRFNADPQARLAYYRQVVQVVQERLPGHPLADEVAAAVEDLARAMEEVGVEE